MSNDILVMLEKVADAYNERCREVCMLSDKIERLRERVAELERGDLEPIRNEIADEFIAKAKGGVMEAMKLMVDLGGILLFLSLLLWFVIVSVKVAQACDTLTAINTHLRREWVERVAQGKLIENAKGGSGGSQPENGKPS